MRFGLILCRSAYQWPVGNAIIGFFRLSTLNRAGSSPAFSGEAMRAWLLGTTGRWYRILAAQEKAAQKRRPGRSAGYVGCGGTQLPLVDWWALLGCVDSEADRGCPVWSSQARATGFEPVTSAEGASRRIRTLYSPIARPAPIRRIGIRVGTPRCGTVGPQDPSCIGTFALRIVSASDRRKLLGLVA